MGPLAAVLLAGLVSEPPSSASIDCSFPPGQATAGQTINVLILPRSTEANRVSMVLNDKVLVPAVVRATTDRGHEAVLMRGVSSRKFTYTIGMHLDGTAVLEVRAPDAPGQHTRVGTCAGHHAPMQNWIEK